MTRPLLVTLLALSATAACGGGKEQSFKEGMELLCGSTARLPSTLSSTQKAAAIARVADEKVTNKEVRELATSFAALEGDQKVARLKEAATRAGIAHCGLAELWTVNPMARSLRIICEAPDKLPVPAGADPSTRAQAMADYIKANVSDPEALKLMGELATLEPGARGPELARVARDNGIERCPLAEMP
jgi:hypothetical protein